MIEIEWHKHHIIPKHVGGSDEKSNLIKVNRAMHIFMHKELYKKHKRWQDKAAYKLMSGKSFNFNPHINKKIVKPEFKTAFICDYCCNEVNDESFFKWHEKNCKGSK